MERVVFIVEATGEQIPCLLNPESLLLQRQTGVAKRVLKGGLLSAQALADDPILFSGGGTTFLTINLLFDVNLPDAPPHSHDVRDLTGALWQLSENTIADGSRKTPALTRLIWGKAFNFPGVIKEISERLEYFTAEGVPQRSFIRLRMQRVAEDYEDLVGGALAPPPLPEDLNLAPPTLGEDTLSHVAIGAEASPDAPGEVERLDQLAFDYYGSPTEWRLLAWLNNIDNPLQLTLGTVLQVPSENDVQP